MRKTKEKRGITLIALIITIIVLLILAGVTISMVVGDNGVVNQAMNAKEKTDEAIRKEKSDFDKSSELADELVNGIESVEQVVDEYPGKLEDDNGIKVINSIEDLVVFAYDVTNGNNYEHQTVKLGLSLDFNSAKSYIDAYRIDYGKYGYNGELKPLLTSGEGFKPIGTTIEENKDTQSFAGIFDGNNKFIDNLIQGNLFVYNCGTIKNLEVRGNVKGTKGKGIVGTNYGEINNIKNYIDFNINNNSGGVVAKNKGTVSNCYNYGSINVSGGVTVGGIVGYNEEGTITNCYNYGKLYSKLDEVSLNAVNLGGIVGSNKGKVEKCMNYDEVKCDRGDCVGGICGINYSTMKNCYNKGRIYGANWEVGGICGYMVNGKVESCYNIGSVCGYKNVGGVTGSLKGGVISNCKSKCDISNIEGSRVNFGGVIGQFVKESVTSCEWYSEDIDYGIGSTLSNDGAEENESIVMPEINSVIN